MPPPAAGALRDNRVVAAEGVSTRPMTVRDGPTLSAAFRAVGWQKPEALFARYAQEQVRGERDCFVGAVHGALVGYVTLCMVSRYPAFAARGIPEVVDLNVLPGARRQGVGGALMETAECAARRRGASVVGLGVGLYRDYGSAQRLYVRRGYLPDGCGLMYDYEPVTPGETIRIDDDAILMLTKTWSR